MAEEAGAKKATKFNVYSANPYGMSFRWKQLLDAVRLLFEQTLAPGFEGVVVQNTMGRPYVSSKELLVYMVPSQSRALVSTHFKVAPGVDGTTVYDKKSRVSASEVYVGKSDPGDVANMVFHEALHNKLQRSDTELHGKGGIADAPLQRKLTPRDISLMKEGMARSVAQWLGGWDWAIDPRRDLDL